MGNINNFGRKDWSCASVTRESCSTVAESYTAGTAKVFTALDAPRFITANGDGTIITKDWASTPNVVTRNVVTGQIIYHIPKEITGGTAAYILEY